jgi:hypothetical protein
MRTASLLRGRENKVRCLKGQGGWRNEGGVEGEWRKKEARGGEERIFGHHGLEQTDEVKPEGGWRENFFFKDG